MKFWTEEDLILLYYQELDPVLAQKIKQTMAESIDLQREYDVLCNILDAGLEVEVPKPSEDLNQKIMVAINLAESEKRRAAMTVDAEGQKSKSVMIGVLGQKVARWLAVSPSYSARPALMFTALVLVGIFYLGRWSVEPVETSVVHLDTINKTEQSNLSKSYRSNSLASRRVLLTNVSSHIETSQRLLTLVSNGKDDPTGGIELRRQMLDELISFNRLYRRMAEQSNDTMLASVLQQTESVLLEINHTKSVNGEWEKVRVRLQGTDLLYKLKVTDKKINRELI